MDATKREIRTIECKLAVREAEGSADPQSESRTITGTAIVFNSESEVLDDWGERFREVILPEAASAEFLGTQDVKMNLLHNRDNTLARCNKGVGNLRLWVDDKGVNFEFDAPRCDLGDQALELVRSGVYSGCSFEFLPQDYRIEERGEDKEVLITHKRFAAITALTLGMDPAYSKTSVNAREMHKDPAEDEKKAAEERERQEKELRLKREREIAESQRLARERDLYFQANINF